MTIVERAGDIECGLGEVPLWDVAEHALYFTADGATVDSDGRLWTAVCGGDKVACCEANGTLAHIVIVPPRLVSSVMFGGPDLDHLCDIDRPVFAAIRCRREGCLRGTTVVISDLGVHGIPEPRYARGQSTADSDELKENVR